MRIDLNGSFSGYSGQRSLAGEFAQSTLADLKVLLSEDNIAQFKADSLEPSNVDSNSSDLPRYRIVVTEEGGDLPILEGWYRPDSQQLSHVTEELIVLMTSMIDEAED